MEKNEIKKALYREKPKATMLYVRRGMIHYTSKLASGEDIQFEVPVNDTGEADFLPEMEASLLIRYLA